MNYVNPSNIYAKSIETGVFPNKLEVARVSPVYKASDSSDLTNYRPISVLPCPYKIPERIMSNHLFSYVPLKKKFYIQNNSVFNLAIQQSILFYN